MSFELEANDADGPVVSGVSTFLMSGPDVPAVIVSEPEPEPGPDVGSVDEPAGESRLRAASRADLVRYAGASRDWNPIHWDHDSATAAGLPGVVVHGLLQSAWLTIEAGAMVEGDRPFPSARFRYRAPLRPAVTVRVTASSGDGGRIDAALVSEGAEYVTGVFRTHE